MKYLKTFEISYHEQYIKDDAKANQVIGDIFEIFFNKSNNPGGYTLEYNYVSGEYHFFVEIEYVDEQILKPIKEMCDWLTVDWYLQTHITEGNLGKNPVVRQYFTASVSELDDILKSLDVFKQSDKYNL